MERRERHRLYDDALAALVSAKVAHESWDAWKEERKLTDAYEMVGELFDTTRAKEEI